MKAFSPLADFSFDYHDLEFTPVATRSGALTLHKKRARRVRRALDTDSRIRASQAGAARPPRYSQSRPGALQLPCGPRKPRK